MGQPEERDKTLRLDRFPIKIRQQKVLPVLLRMDEHMIKKQMERLADLFSAQAPREKIAAIHGKLTQTETVSASQKRGYGVKPAGDSQCFPGGTEAKRRIRPTACDQTLLLQRR